MGYIKKGIRIIDYTCPKCHSKAGRITTTCSEAGCISCLLVATLGLAAFGILFWRRKVVCRSCGYSWRLKSMVEEMP